MQIKTQGFVLKQRNIGENDKIITLLTPDLGIIEASARNVKSGRSGLASACQLMTYSEFCLYRGKSGYSINTAEVTEAFYSLRLDVIKVALAGYFCELTTYLSPSGENTPDYLRLLLNTLSFLQTDKRNPLMLKAIFELRGAAIAGFMPNLVCCTECSHFEKEEMYFLLLEGVLICSDCFSETELFRKDSPIVSVPTPILSALRHIVYAPMEKLYSFKLEEQALSQLQFITEQFALFHTDGNFRSLEIYKSLVI